MPSIDLPEVDFSSRKARNLGTKSREFSREPRGGENSTCSACRKSNLFGKNWARNVNEVTAPF